LSNLVHRATLNCDGTQLLANHFGVVAMRGGTDLPPSHFRVARAATIESFERRFVEDLLRKHRGNVTRAAREAEKDRRVFGRLIKKYAIDRHNC
jgi:DNA-binding NtrC family response regulator